MRTSLRPILAGLFLTLAAATSFAQTPPANAVQLQVDTSKPGPTISKYLYGQFSEHLGHCIYDGIWVGPDSKIPNTNGYRSDTLQALKTLKVPLLRWPGGCFADEYHWRDGIGPREQRPKLINNHWGGVVEDNSFGTHEFLDYCEMIGADAYVAVNVGSGTVQEMMDWVEYMTRDGDSPMANLRRKNGRDKPWKVKFIGVGNEAWGCGGNMRPEFYADEFRKYSTFIKDYSGNKVTKIACGPDGGNTEWTDTVMRLASRNRMGGIALHYYTLPSGSWSGKKGSATDFDENAWQVTLARTLKMEDLITDHLAVMEKNDPQKRVPLVIDEWGTWYDVEPGTNPGFLYQQNTLRDALVAGLNLHIFQQHADRISVACIAQMVNVLQAMILTDKEKFLLTPTYHVFRMFQVHQDAVALPLQIETPQYVAASGEGKNGLPAIPAVTASASRDKNGVVHISLVNTDPHKPATLTATLAGVTGTAVTGEVLTADAINACNTFDKPDAVKPVPFTAAKLNNGKLQVDLPSKCVVMLEIR